MNYTKQQAEHILSEYNWMVDNVDISTWNYVTNMYIRSGTDRNQWGVYADVSMNCTTLVEGVPFDYTVGEICGIPMVSRSFADEYGFNGIGRYRYCGVLDKKQAFTIFQSGLEDVFCRVSDKWDQVELDESAFVIYRQTEQSGEYRFYVDSWNGSQKYVMVQDYLMNADGIYPQLLVDDLRSELGWTDNQVPVIDVNDEYESTLMLFYETEAAAIRAAIELNGRLMGTDSGTWVWKKEPNDDYSVSYISMENLSESLPEDLRYLLDSPLTEDEMNTLRTIAADGMK